MAVDYNHYPTTQYANSGPYGTSIGATYEYSGGVNEHRPESPTDDKVCYQFRLQFRFYCPHIFVERAYQINHIKTDENHLS